MAYKKIVKAEDAVRTLQGKDIHSDKATDALRALHGKHLGSAKKTWARENMKAGVFIIEEVKERKD